MRRCSIRIVLLVIVLIVIPFLQISSQEKISPQKLTLMDSAIQELDSAVRGTATQEGLAIRLFDGMQSFEYNTGFIFSYYASLAPPFLGNLPKFEKVLDFTEKRWLSFPMDDCYDEVGIFLLWGNIAAGRYDKADTLFTQMKGNLRGKSVDPYFYSNSLMKAISETSLCKKLFSPREDLSLLHATQMVIQMYEYQKKDAKYWESIKLIIDNYGGRKGAELLSIMYEYREAELKYGSKESIPEEERKRLTDNMDAAFDKMRKMCEE
jgi:hypothetical protein